MEFLTAICCGIVGKVAEYTIEPVGRQVGYLIHYKRDLETLRIQLAELSDARLLVEQKVDEAMRRGERIKIEVEHWLSKVNEITAEANVTDEHLAKMKCVHGFCPNPMIIYKLSRKSTKLVHEVVELYGTISFNIVSYASYPQEEVILSTTDNVALDSRVSTVNKIMVELRNPNTNRIGVYGLGGVGKTTLVEEVYRQATLEKLFDDVIIILAVKQNPDLERIQKLIAEKLGLDVVEIETLPERARRIWNRIKDKKSLVVLDDLWESMDLETLGIPDVATCKILLTARNRKVSGEMHTQKDFLVDPLNEEESWRLFEKTAGDVVKDFPIRSVAIEVAKRCGGLPVLIVTVASALRNKNRLHVWKDALRSLKAFDRSEALTQKASLAIESSYYQLEDEKLKQLFLLCGITAGNQNYISIEDLLIYSIGLGWLRNVSIEEARETLHSLIERLKDSGLLLDSNENGLVKMHDLLLNVAISIAFRDHHILSKAYGDKLRDWPNKDFFQKCTMISLPNCSIPDLPRVFECPEVILFHLSSSDDSLEISGNLFEEMKKLQVLDLTNLCIPSLLPSLPFLKNIQTLGLHGCMLGDIALVGELRNLDILSFAGSNVKHLPKEMGQLSRLRLLDLNNCTELEVISPNVISSFKRLEELRMENSFNQWEAEGVIGERSNASISELKHLSQLTALAIHILDAEILPAGLFANMLERYRILIGAEWKWDGVDESFDRLLKLKLTRSNQLDHGLEMLLTRSESLYLDSLDYQLDSEDFQQLKHLHVQNSNVDTNIINVKVALPNLSSLVVHRCNGLRFMLSSSTARSLMQLKHLEITECQMMEEIVSTKQYDDEIITDNMFHQLQHLKLKGLPNLAWFCSGSVDIEFLSLEMLQLENCANLETFISHSLTKYIAMTDNEIVEGHSKENPETAVEYFLFDDKVRFPRLERLFIDGLTKLTTIWYNKLFTRGSFSALEDVRVRQCNDLIRMFVLLEESGAAEEVIANDEGAIKFLFPKVTSVTFENLPQLKSFYLGKHASNWPSLKTLVMNGCDKVEMFATELSCFQNTSELGGLSTPVEQSFFLIEKDGLRNLTSLVFQRCVGLRSLLSSFVARSLVKLIHLEISACQVMEEIISEKIHGEENPNQIFFKLEQLELNDLPNLARFCSENYIKLSSLKTLKVVECAQMNKFIFDPLNKRIAIFKETEGSDSNKTHQTVVQHFIFDVEKVVLPNLTSLIIHRLDGLNFLLSPSMARSVVQFKHREKPENGEEIESATENGEEIKSATENGEENLDDVFSKLELLELNDVPSLAKLGDYIEFPSIQSSNIVECIKLETVFHPEIKIYKEIEDMHSQENLESVVYSFLFYGKVVLRNITRLIIYRCYGSSSLLSSDMARSCVQLKHVEISECHIMEEIVSLEECSGANIDVMLPNLEQLVLIDLPELTRFCSGSHVEFQSLETLQLEKCTKLETFVKEIEERDTEENLETVVPNFLFDNKVVFPKLKRLTINDLPKLTKIWGSQLHEKSFCELRDVTVQQCNSLINIVPDSIIARVFKQLQKLKVENCGLLKEVVAEEEGETSMPDLPEVTCLEFSSLPQLKRFYPRMHDFNWPRLKKLELFHCQIVDIFASGFSGLPKTPDLVDPHNPVKQPSVLIEKSIFPNLEYLTLGPMDIWYGPPDPAAFCKQAVFPGISSRHTDKTIPHLKKLRLHGMEKHMRLWEENTEPGGPVFLQLKTLEVKFCGLNNIELSAISFKNLTNLEVTFCWRLQYLTTYPVARSLVHLKKLKVDECKSMKEILANDGDGEDESNCEIVFSQLQHLELSDLISLERFCSRNCTVKVPFLETSALVVNWCSLKLKISSDKTLEEVDSNMHLNVQKSHSRKEEAGATTEAAGSLETNQKQPPLNASESDLQELLRTKEAENIHLQELLRTNEVEKRHLQELLRANEAENRDKEPKLAKRDLHQLILKELAN